MATETQKYANHVEREARHSALAEFSRDERRPAVLLLSALVLAVLFFAIGLLVGRWTAEPGAARRESPRAASTTPASQPVAAPQAEPSQQQPAESSQGATTPSADAARRFTLLVATYDTAEKAQSLIKVLQDAGFSDVRATPPRAGETRPRHSVLAGRFTQEEAREAARRMRAVNDPRLKNPRVIEDR